MRACVQCARGRGSHAGRLTHSLTHSLTPTHLYDTVRSVTDDDVMNDGSDVTDYASSSSSAVGAAEDLSAELAAYELVPYSDQNTTHHNTHTVYGRDLLARVTKAPHHKHKYNI